MQNVKRIILLLIGFVPLMLFGFYINHLIPTVFAYTAGLDLPISIAVLVVWFIFGMISVLLVSSKKEALLLLNAPAFLVLLLIFFQELILGHMWLNQIGIATQMFYLPLVLLGSIFGSLFPLVSFGIISAISFIFLLCASYFGRITSERLRKF